MTRILAAAAFALLAGCATLTGGSLVREGEATGTLIVANQSGFGLDALTLSRCSAMSHGLNRLGGGQMIGNNTRMSFTLGAGCWDIMVGRTGTCTENSCRWLQSPPRRFYISAGGTEVIQYGPEG